MAKLVNFDQLPDYPDIYISKRTKEHIKTSGLIEPLVRMPDGSIHKNHRELYQAFKNECMIHNQVNTCLVVDWHELSKNDKLSI